MMKGIVLYWQIEVPFLLIVFWPFEKSEVLLIQEAAWWGPAPEDRGIQCGQRQ